MIDILKFIDSPAIREHNRKIKFTPAEQTVLIVNSMGTTVEKKMNALQQLIDSYNDQKFQEETVHTNLGTDIGIRNSVINLLKIWNMLLDIRNRPGHEIYIARFYEKGATYGIDRYFSTYGAAYESLCKQKHKYIEDEALATVQTYAFIDRIMLDYEADYDRFVFDNQLRLIDLLPASERYKEIGMDVMDSPREYYMYIPVPFKIGDIVKVQNFKRNAYYGVVPCNPLKNRKDFCLRYGDATDMIMSLDVYDTEKEEFTFTDSTPYLEMDLCSDDELPENLHILKEISMARKGEMDWYSLLRKV